MDESANEDKPARRPEDRLHGVTLETMLDRLVEHVGWDEIGRRIKIRCFTDDPSISSSLKFLSETPWARDHASPRRSRPVEPSAAVKERGHSAFSPRVACRRRFSSGLARPLPNDNTGP